MGRETELHYSGAIGLIYFALPVASAILWIYDWWQERKFRARQHTLFTGTTRTAGQSAWGAWCRRILAARPPQRIIIRALLFIFCLTQGVYFLGFLIYGTYRTGFYGSHIFAIWALSVAFLSFSAMWVNQLVAPNAKKCTQRIAQALGFGYTVLGMFILVLNARYGWDAVVGHNSMYYRAWFLGTEGTNLLVCLGFLFYALRTCRKVLRARSSQDLFLGPRIGVIIGSCAICFIMRMSLNVIILLQSTQPWAQEVSKLNRILWHLLYNYFPDFGIVFVIYFLTGAPRKRRAPVTYNDTLAQQQEALLKDKNELLDPNNMDPKNANSNDKNDNKKGSSHSASSPTNMGRAIKLPNHVMIAAAESNPTAEPHRPIYTITPSSDVSARVGAMGGAGYTPTSLNRPSATTNNNNNNNNDENQPRQNQNGAKYHRNNNRKSTRAKTRTTTAVEDSAFSEWSQNQRPYDDYDRGEEEEEEESSVVKDWFKAHKQQQEEVMALVTT